MNKSTLILQVIPKEAFDVLPTCYLLNCSDKEGNTPMSQESDLRARRLVIKAPLAQVSTSQEPGYRFIHTHCWGDRAPSGAQVQVHLSEVDDTAICALCQQPIHPVPYVFHEVVQFRPHFGQAYLERGRKYALILGVQWYGQWVIDIQHLCQHEYDPEFLELTPVKEYMVPAYAVERAPLQWSPTNTRVITRPDRLY